MKRCNTCKHWGGDGWDNPGKKSRQCTNSKKIGESYDVDKESDNLVYGYDEGGRFWAGPAFGCVHHAKKPTPCETKLVALAEPESAKPPE